MVEQISSPNLERRILSALLVSRGAYDQVISELGPSYKEGFSPITQVVAKLLEGYYSADGAAQSCPKTVLADRCEKEIGNPKHSKQIAEFCLSLDEACSVPNVVLDIRRRAKRYLGDRLVGLLANHREGDEVDALIEEFRNIGSTESLDGTAIDESCIYRAPSTEDLVRDKFSGAGTIPFGIAKLDRACDGGARPGHSVLIYARPEIGKTLLTLHIICNWLQAGKRVLYVGNEDPMSDILLRIVGRLCRRKKEEIIGYPAKADAVARARGYDNLVAASLSPGSIPEIDKLVVKYEPEIVVIDQLRNLDTGDDNRVTSLEKAAISARNLFKRRGVLGVTVTQAGDSGEGKPYLALSDVDFSKTGIPGAIDLAIGVGATTEDKKFGVRGISLPKNKLGGKHEEFPVKFNVETGEVTEV